MRTASSPRKKYTSCAPPWAERTGSTVSNPALCQGLPVVFDWERVEGSFPDGSGWLLPNTAVLVDGEEVCFSEVLQVECLGHGGAELYGCERTLTEICIMRRCTQGSSICLFGNPLLLHSLSVSNRVQRSRGTEYLRITQYK
jgi:hypothetical protein